MKFLRVIHKPLPENSFVWLVRATYFGLKRHYQALMTNLLVSKTIKLQKSQELTYLLRGDLVQSQF